jgi:hypothetical protein
LALELGIDAEPQAVFAEEVDRVGATAFDDLYRRDG